MLTQGCTNTLCLSESSAVLQFTNLPIYQFYHRRPDYLSTSTRCATGNVRQRQRTAAAAGRSQSVEHAGSQWQPPACLAASFSHAIGSGGEQLACRGGERARLWGVVCGCMPLSAERPQRSRCASLIQLSFIAPHSGPQLCCLCMWCVHHRYLSMLLIF